MQSNLNQSTKDCLYATKLQLQRVVIVSLATFKNLRYNTKHKNKEGKFNSEILLDNFDFEYISKWWKLSIYVEHVGKYMAGVR